MDRVSADLLVGNYRTASLEFFLLSPGLRKDADLIATPSELAAPVRVSHSRKQQIFGGRPSIEPSTVV
jgi:hypothetical protein